MMLAVCGLGTRKAESPIPFPQGILSICDHKAVLQNTVTLLKDMSMKCHPVSAQLINCIYTCMHIIILR